MACRPRCHACRSRSAGTISAWFGRRQQLASTRPRSWRSLVSKRLRSPTLHGAASSPCRHLYKASDRPSPPLPHRRSTLEEGADALLAILGGVGIGADVEAQAGDEGQALGLAEREL